MHIVERSGGDPGDAQPAATRSTSSPRIPCAPSSRMGSVVLAVTGAEALYADMGHFGRKPIRVSWIYFVLPALLLNYMGQGAMLLSADAADGAGERSRIPFFYLAPDMLRLPLVLLATAATIIASQAVISGAFSVTQQAIQLGFVPRLRITHTSESAAGQIYIPVDQLGADDHGHPAGADLPQLVEPRRGLWHRGDRRDADRHRADRGRAASACGTGTAIAGRRPARALLHRRRRLSRGEPAQDPRRRLVPAAGRRDRLHLAHHLGEGPPADDRPDERGEPADGDLHQVGGAQRGARARARRCS